MEKKLTFLREKIILKVNFQTYASRVKTLRMVLITHHGGPGSQPGLVKWDLLWTKWRWGRFSPSTSVTPANLHSTKFSVLSPRRGTIGQKWPTCRVDPVWTPSSTMRIKQIDLIKVGSTTSTENIGEKPNVILNLLCCHPKLVDLFKFFLLISY
jgi:hypothetical protein